MIKKISQLDPLPLSAYDKTKWGNSGSADYKEAERKLLETLFEVSYETNHADESPSYYNSYNCNLSVISSMLDLDEVWNTIETILSGGLSVIAISSDLSIGKPGNEQSCLDGHKKYPNNEHSVSCFYPFYEHNRLVSHGVFETHDVANLCSHLSATNSNANFWINSKATFTQLINGTAYRAQWGDLAEIYSADEAYEPGTLVKFGGRNEITIAKDTVNAVVTTEPGVILNGKEKLENPTGIALVGKVPIKVRGPVKKFDNIVLSNIDPGIGVVYNYAPLKTIGKALEDNSDSGTKLVMCATKFNLN